MKILLLCAKGFESMELSVFIDVMGWASNDYGYPVSVETCGFTKKVRGSFDIEIAVNKTVDEISPDDYDALAIPGGFEEYGFYEEAYSDIFLELIRRFDREKKPIASVCVAALALGRSGVLCGRKATTYHLGDGRRQRQLVVFGAKVINERVVVDENIITSYCPETAADVAFELLRMLCGEEKMLTVKRAMGFIK